MYVDDMTVFISDKPSGERLFHVLDMFKAASGLKANVEKTEGMWLGDDKDSADTPFGIKWPKTPIKALGIFHSYDKKAAEKYNFISKLDKLSRQLHWWKARDISIIGRVMLIKTLDLSKFNFAASVLHVPKEIVQRVNVLLGTKCEKVKRDIVNQDYVLGGLRMCGFDICNKAVKLNGSKVI